MTEDEDVLVKEYKIVMVPYPASYLHFVQHGVSSPLLQNMQDAVLAGRFKKTSRRLELDVPLPTLHPTFSAETAQELAAASAKPVSAIRFSGGPLVNSQACTLHVAMINGNVLQLTPLNSFLSLRPNLVHIDEAAARSKAASRRIAEEERPPSTAAAAAAGKTLQVQFRKKETEEQMAARLNSYAYLQRQIDDEPWIQMHHYAAHTEEAIKVAQKLFFSAPDERAL